MGASGLRPIKLFTRLMLVLSACILPVCALSLVSNAYEQRMLYASAVDSQEANASFYMASLEQEVSRLKEITYSYMNDEDFQRLALVYDTLSNYKRVESIVNVREKLSHVRRISSYVANIYLYLPISGRSVNAINTDYELADYELAWFMLPENLGKPVLMNGDKLMVCSYHTLSANQTNPPVMLMSIQLETDEIRAMLSEAADQGLAALVSEDWCVSTRADSADIPERETLEAIAKLRADGSGEFEVEGEGCLFTWRYSKLLDAAMVICVPRALVLGGLVWTQRLLMLMLAASVAALTGTAFGVYRMVHMPMRLLVNAFERVEEGQSDIRLSTNKKDEFQYLYQRFNHMMDRLNSLIEQVYTQKILSQQSQLKQLQMQINPHFFYNSFFAIHCMLEMGDLETAEKMLDNIGQYFRFITRSARDAIPLSDEVAHARSYCEIQKIRFENIRVEFGELPPELSQMQVPRLILQPLLENAYLYGLEAKEGDGRLSVEFAKGEDYLQIVVEDDGGGMSPERLDKLNENLAAPEQGETTGMLNIQRRLKLFFGERAGITLKVNDRDGLTLTMNLPREARRDV